ncbi:hypothetical protein Poli38472_004962 [Pythium oligandrum]|uniref:Uncharacterized protein n=1 Tax=Pythium oligandrum TaxID=41045 RepID=A0A8K1FIM1_PYTOL|nr:hypothetical protein Poli38472_004962 [Pythium oligandrum]|eukprot:TMW59893.1 hypothetical protein Poli38472_004962 [Pythium oligandrum]
MEDEDSALLTALLDTLEADDALQSILPHSETDVLPQKRVVSSKRARDKSSSTRQKEEITSLRAEVDDLERLRKRLRQAHGRRLAVSVAQQELASMWKAIADRQRGLRAKAEKENARLHAQIDNQFRDGRDVTAVLCADLSDSFVTLSFKGNTKVAGTRARQEHLYKQTHVAFTDPCFSDGSKTFRDFKIIDDDGMATIIGGREGWTSPFTANELDRALWATLRRDSTWRDGDYVTELEVTDDSVVVTLESIAATQGDVILGKFQSKIVIRRFQESPDAPSVYISCFYAEPMPSDGSAEQLTAYEIMWYRIREISTGEDVTLAPISQLQASRRLCIDCSGSPPSSRKETLEIVTEFALEALRRDAESIQELVEHELVRSSASSPPVYSSELQLIE